MKSQATNQPTGATKFLSTRRNDSLLFSAASFLSLLLLLCTATNAVSQQLSTVSASSSAPATSTAKQALIPVYLATSIDSRKLKVDEEVDAKTASLLRLADGTVLASGTKVIGHATEAKAKAKGDSESSLKIVFDKVSLKDGKTLPIQGTIRAVAPNPKADNQALSGIGYVGMQETLEKPQISPDVSKNVPILTNDSVGVLGIKNLELGKDGVLTSDGKVVKLEGGSQMMLAVEVTGGE